MKWTKSQSAIEGMIALGIVLFLFLSVYIIYETRQRSVALSEQELNERKDCLRVANAITNALVLGKGAELRVKIGNGLIIYPFQQRIESPHSFCTFPSGGVSATGSRTITNTTNITLTPGTVVVSRPDWVGVRNE